MSLSEQEYSAYRRLTLKRPSEPIADTPEYRLLAEKLPHTANVLLLRKKCEGLQVELKTAKTKYECFRLKRELMFTKTKLKQELYLQRIRGESKWERAFRTKALKETVRRGLKGPLVLLTPPAIPLGVKKVSEGSSVVKIRLRHFLRSLIPPPVFSLKSMDMALKREELHEWLRNKRLRRIKTPS